MVKNREKSPHIFLNRAQNVVKKNPGQENPCFTASYLRAGCS